MTPRRLIEGVDDPRHRPLADELANVVKSAPPSLSGAAVARIRASVTVKAKAKSERRSAEWGQLRAWSPALIAAVLLAGWWLWPRSTPSVTATHSPTPTVAAAPRPAVATVVATPSVEPTAPSVSLPARRGARHPRGAILVRAIDRPTVLDLPGGPLVVAPRSHAQVELHGYAVHIATYESAVTVIWSGQTYLIPAGSTRDLLPPVHVASPQTADAEEAELLARVLKVLRVDHDRDAAGELLDQYARRFPAGELRDEAARLRAEANGL